ncbi:MAG: PspA/IM30 family protein [Chloroflexi bacterium]|nr:MAG: PspA/IM30 family protein [Chloroflexota bacterium]
MGLLSRVLMLLRIKSNSALDSVEDPRQVLDYAYSQQQEMLRKLRGGLVEVATAKQQLSRQSQLLAERVPALEDQARRAVEHGREDLARVALERKHSAAAELEGLGRQLAEVADEERKLGVAERQLASRIEEFRIHREVVSAKYSAAHAHVSISEAITGVSGELAELGMAVGRAEEKTDRLRARASAIDALIESGTLGANQAGDSIEAELRRLSTADAVESELAALLELAPKRLPGRVPAEKEES